MIFLQKRRKKRRHNLIFSIKRAYFVKKKARSQILLDFGQVFYALSSFTGQQYFDSLQIAEIEVLHFKA